MPKQASSYVPGVCNINSAETAQRRQVGYVGVAMYIVLLVALLLLPVDRWVRLILIFPAVLAASGFLQARHHFCVGYGSAGMQNASEGSATAVSIQEQAAIDKDKRRARQINQQALAIGLFAGFIATALPVFSN